MLTFLLIEGLEQRFGLGLLPSDFQTKRIVSRPGNYRRLPTGYYRPWAIAAQASHDLVKKKKDHYFGVDGFQACVDVLHFQPSEITVKVVGHTVIVEGKHEERDDAYGVIERHFVRKYTLPEDYDTNALISSLSSDGVLTLKAPLPKTKGRFVPIAHSNVPMQLSVKYNTPVSNSK